MIGLPIPPATASPTVIAVALVLAAVGVFVGRTRRHTSCAPKESPQ